MNKLSKDIVFSEEDVVLAFRGSVMGLHASHAKWTPGSESTLRMWLNQIRNKKLCQMNQSKIKNIKNGQN